MRLFAWVRQDHPNSYIFSFSQGALTEMQLPKSRKKECFVLPLAALSAIAIVMIVESLFTASTEPLTGLPWLQPTADDGMVVAKRSMFDVIDGSWIIVGDSSALHGLRPDLLRDIGKISTVNLATLSSLTTLGFTEMAIDAISKNEVSGVIFAVLPQSLEVSKEDAERYGQLDRYLAAYGSYLNVWPVSLRARFDLYIRRHRINTFPPHFEGSVEGLENKLRERSGFYPERNNEWYTTEKEEFINQKFALDGLDAAAAFASERGLPFVLLLMPKPDSSVSSRYADGVRAFQKRLLLQRQKLTVFPDQWQTLPDEMFGTETHLNATGASVYSTSVARFLVESDLNSIK